VSGPAAPKASIRRAVATDFEEVYALLREFHNPRVAREDYRRLFTRQWESAEDWYGFVLEAEGAIAGFASLLFSTRQIRGEAHRFANFNHWIVKPEYRNAHGLSLLFAAMRLKDVTLTVYTPVARVIPIYEKLRWQVLERRTQIIPALPFFPRSRGLIFSPAAIEPRLPDAERAIFRDHLPYPCGHLFIEHGASGCYVTYTRVIRKRLPFVAIHHISNTATFLQNVNNVRFRLCLREKALALLVDERFLPNYRAFGAFYHSELRFFRSTTVSPSDIDGLYSEYIVVNL